MYKIIVTGLAAGSDLENAKKQLASLFKTDSQNVGRLLTGAHITVKTGLPLADARRYLEALKLAGAACEIENETSIDPRSLQTARGSRRIMLYGGLAVIALLVVAGTMLILLPKLDDARNANLRPPTESPRTVTNVDRTQAVAPVLTTPQPTLPQLKGTYQCHWDGSDLMTVVTYFEDGKFLDFELSQVGNQGATVTMGVRSGRFGQSGNEVTHIQIATWSRAEPWTYRDTDLTYTYAATLLGTGKFKYQEIAKTLSGKKEVPEKVTFTCERWAEKDAEMQQSRSAIGEEWFMTADQRQQQSAQTNPPPRNHTCLQTNDPKAAEQSLLGMRNIAIQSMDRIANTARAECKQQVRLLSNWLGNIDREVDQLIATRGVATANNFYCQHYAAFSRQLQSNSCY